MCFPPDFEKPDANLAGPGQTWRRHHPGSVPTQLGQEDQLAAHWALHTKAHFAKLLFARCQLGMLTLSVYGILVCMYSE